MSAKAIAPTVALGTELTVVLDACVAMSRYLLRVTEGWVAEGRGNIDPDEPTCSPGAPRRRSSFSPSPRAHNVRRRTDQGDLHRLA